MNVLLLIDQSGSRWSSQEDFCLRMTEALRERGGLCVAAYSSQPADVAYSRLAKAGCVITVASSGGRLVQFCLDIRSLCQRYDISFVHLMHYPPSTTLTLALPLLLDAGVVISDWSGGAGEAKSPMKQALFRLFNRVMNCGVSHFIAPSQFVYNRLVSFRGISAKKVTLIPNGVDLDRFTPAGDIARAPAQQRIALKPGTVLILVACNLYPLKAVDVLLRSFVTVKKKLTAAVLAIAGDGPERGNLEVLARHLGVQDSVLFLGQRSDMPELLAAADVFCCPSVWGESFGWVNAEAMACGVPVVAAASGAVPEVVAHGETGLLVHPGDEESMADALLKVLTSQEMRAAMGVAGRRRVEVFFELARNVKEHLALYERVKK